MKIFILVIIMMYCTCALYGMNYKKPTRQLGNYNSYTRAMEKAYEKGDGEEIIRLWKLNSHILPALKMRVQDSNDVAAWGNKLVTTIDGIQEEREKRLQQTQRDEQKSQKTDRSRL